MQSIWEFKTSTDKAVRKNKLKYTEQKIEQNKSNIIEV